MSRTKEIVIGDPREWKTANDSKSGRVYYYNTRTKETTWNKPIELASPAEQKEMIAQKKATLKFFKEMEENIFDRAKGLEPKASRRISGYFEAGGKNKAVAGKDAKVTFDDSAFTGQTRGRLDSFSGGPPRRIRTISTVDDEILLSMRLSHGNDRKANSMYNPSTREEEKRASPHVVPYRTRTGSRDFPDEIPLPLKINSRDVVDDSEVKVPSKKQKNAVPKAPVNKRRNSTGTIYVNTTMSKQDNNATIQCVCVVIRAHMIDAARDKTVPSTAYDVFKDSAYVNNSLDRDDKQHYSLSLVPSLAVVKEFFSHIFSKSQLESDCIIMALIYIERLVKETKGRLCIRYDNWRSILFACLVMASKVWDDLSMWNVDFSHVYPSFDLQRVNTLELAMLDALKYVIRVSASEYAKYYFHLRSMIPRLGLDGGKESNFIKPLDINGARKLQLSTEKYEAANNDVPRRRHMSMHVSGKIDRQLTEGGDSSFTHTLGLEEIIGLEHTEAGGQTKSVSSKSNHFSHK